MISESLKLKYPDAKHCTSSSCKFTDKDHEVFMAHEQKTKEQEKRGEIKVMYKLNYPKPDTKFFMWFNGKEWIELSNSTIQQEGNEKNG